MSSKTYANPDALVSSEWLGTHLTDPGLRIVEIDVSSKSYDEGHIPGAVFWDIYKDLKDSTYRLVDNGTFERLLERSGITENTQVVFYGYGPALGYWLLKLYRHPNVGILNLSKAAWRGEGRPLTTDKVEQTPTRYPLPSMNEAIRELHSTIANAIGAAGPAIFDVRSEAEYRGERFWPSGTPEEKGRPGHIPGAFHVPIDGVFGADGSYAPAEKLRSVFPQALDDFHDIVTYCTIGNRASIAWFVLSELLGRHNVRVYDGSWAEWGFLPGAQVETAQGGAR